MQIIDTVLHSPALSNISREEHEERYEVIFKELLKTVYFRVSRGLLEKDKMMFAFRLVQIRLGHVCEDQIDLFLKGTVYLGENVPELLEGRIS